MCVCVETSHSSRGNMKKDKQLLSRQASFSSFIVHKEVSFQYKSVSEVADSATDLFDLCSDEKDITVLKYYRNCCRVPASPHGAACLEGHLDDCGLRIASQL